MALSFVAGFVAIGVTSVIAGPAEDVRSAMEDLKEKTAALGSPSVKGETEVAGKRVSRALLWNDRSQQNFDIGDEVRKEKGGTATLVVKSGEEYVRVSTNVMKDDGSRAIGTILDQKGKVIGHINKDEAFYGDVDILGKPYTTGYEPIHDNTGKVIGIYYVGYPKQ